MQISGQKPEDSGASPLAEDKWLYASTELRHAERVKRVLTAYSLNNVVDMPFILSVIDGHGLFHQPIPAPKQLSKDIRREAKAAANRLGRWMKHIRAGQEAATDAREQRLADEWPRLGSAALKLEAEKIRCATYQTMRGGRIVSVGKYANRRPEVELTHALLLIDYHLTYSLKHAHRTHAQRMACLTSLVIAIQDLREEATFVAARVRDRLRKARKNEALQFWRGEYLETLSAFIVTEDMVYMHKRQQQFAEMMGIFFSPQHDAAAQEEAAARLGPSFRVS
ncbi:MAG: hypothetical protein ACREIG_09005 [Nitrospiraceae bacterium]